MGVGARGAWAALVLGVLLMLALLKAAVDSAGLDGSLNTKNSVPSGNHSANPTENVTFVTSNYTSQSTTSSTKPLTTPLSPVSKTATATARITTAGVSANRISTSSGSQNTTQATLATETIAHNSSATALSLSVTITPTINSKGNPRSKFDTGSFLGGIVLTLGVLSILYIGCRMYYSRRGIRYRTIHKQHLFRRLWSWYIRHLSGARRYILVMNMTPSSKEVKDQWKKIDTALSINFSYYAMHIIYNVLYKHVEIPPGY